MLETIIPRLGHENILNIYIHSEI